MRRASLSLAIAVYCAAILLACDFAYSNLFHAPERPLRVVDPEFHHGLAANFDGYDIWNFTIYPMRTNSLGFKDAAARTVPLKSELRRVLLIGDSFTEGIGLSFEDSFAGLLYRAGLGARAKTEFLNAGVASYSPVIFYRKIKHLLAHGLTFDEVVVLSDLSDVVDEAMRYFCIDEDPAYRAHCGGEGPPQFEDGRLRKSRLQQNFVILDRTLQYLKLKLQALHRNDAIKVEGATLASWTVTREFDDLPKPLGIEGGIARSLKNMQALADLLRQRAIPLTVVVHPWPIQLAFEDRDSRQVAIWREFCKTNCKAFIDLFPAMFAEKDAHADWYDRLFLPGDFHYSAYGNQVVFRELSRHLLAPGR
jgi:hypothetical protein